MESQIFGSLFWRPIEKKCSNSSGKGGFHKDNYEENQGFCQNVIPSINFRKLAEPKEGTLPSYPMSRTALTSLPHVHQGLQDRRIHSTVDPWALNRMHMWST